MSCKFCKSIIVNRGCAPLVFLKYYKNFFAKIIDYTIGVLSNLQMEYGKEIILRIEICDDCYKKFKNVSMFDFKTEKNGEKKVKELIRLYTENGFKTGNIFLKGIMIESPHLGDEQQYMLKTTPELFERDKIYVKLAALIFSMRDIDERDALLAISEVFFKTKLKVPEHELFIYFSYFFEKLKNSDGLIKVCHKMSSRGSGLGIWELNKIDYIRELASELIWLDAPDKELAKELFDSIDPFNYLT